MNPISSTRIRNQNLSDPKITDVTKLVGHFGAMQAQDYAMAKWAIGCRIPGSKIADVEQALQSGTIVRTHVLRPTWHFTAAQDIRWMLDLTAPNIHRALFSHSVKSGLGQKEFHAAFAAFSQALRDGASLTRKELLANLQNLGIETANRGSLLLMAAELEQLIISGPPKNN